jgi:hypothetical protein
MAAFPNFGPNTPATRPPSRLTPVLALCVAAVVIVAVVAVVLLVAPPTRPAAPKLVTIDTIGLTWAPNASACRTSSLN